MDLAIILIGLSVFLGLGIWLAIYLYKKSKAKQEFIQSCNFITKYNTRVWLSPASSHLTKEDFDKFIDTTIQFWIDKKGWPTTRTLEYLNTTSIFLYDLEKIQHPLFGTYHNAWWDPVNNMIDISTQNISQTVDERVASLIRHEVSHIICSFDGEMGVPSDGGAEQHKLYREVGLGA